MTLPLLLRRHLPDGGGTERRCAESDRIIWISDDGTTLEWPFQPRGLEGRGAPPVSIVSTPLPSHGEMVSRRRWEARPIYLPLTLAGLPAPLRTQAREWVRGVAAAEGGTLRVISVVGDTREIRAHYAGGAEWSEGWNRAHRVTLQLLAPWPFWQDGSDQVLSWNAAAAGKWFPIPKPSGVYIRLAGSVLQGQSITNDGDVDAWPVWTITGPATANSSGSPSISITNLDTGEAIELARDLGTGERIVVDTRPGAKTVVDQSGASLWEAVQPGASLFPLRRGVNRIQVRIEDPQSQTRVSARWRRQWLTA